jgi:hypothetical protein
MYIYYYLKHSYEISLKNNLLSINSLSCQVEKAYNFMLKKKLT